MAAGGDAGHAQGVDQRKARQPAADRRQRGIDHREVGDAVVDTGAARSSSGGPAATGTAHVPGERRVGG